MIERKFVSEKLKEFQIQEHVDKILRGVGQSNTKLQKTPLGEKIIVSAAKPGLVVGRGGENIKKLTKTLKKKFGLENPQIEIAEVDNINLDANIVAEYIATSLERFGSSKFKGVGHKTMENVMNAGALGVEIIISGKIPGSRAKSWRFYQGYLKKCGDTALTGIKTSYKTANLKTGTIGIQVRIMPPDIELVDKMEFITEGSLEEVKEVANDESKKEKTTKKNKANDEKESEEVKEDKKGIKKDKEIKTEEKEETEKVKE
jgi:small subunit ribosomal protein S3